MTAGALERSRERSAALPVLPADGTVVVVGGSLAGLRAAQELRRAGHAGRLVLVGEESHHPYDRPPLSKQVLAGTWEPERTSLADPAALDDLSIEARFGRRAIALDAEACRVELDDGTVLVADGVVVATGARPRRLPGTEGLEGVTVLRTLEDSIGLRRRIEACGPGCRVIVVGAGFIGSEVASTCAAAGCSVTVLEALATPLAGALGPEVGAACGRLHERGGVELRTGVGVRSVHAAGSGSEPEGSGIAAGPGSPDVAELTVELSDGSTMSADVVVVGIGVVPAVDWLDGSGLTIDNGVVTDTALFAADRVVAAGDVARWSWHRLGLTAERGELTRIEHWEAASQMGSAAARALLAGRGTAPAFTPVPYFWSDQYGLRLQMLGHAGPDDEIAVVDGALDAEDGKFVALYGRDGRLTAALGVSRPRKLMAFRPLLEAGARWSEALELAQQL